MCVKVDTSNPLLFLRLEHCLDSFTECIKIRCMQHPLTKWRTNNTSKKIVLQKPFVHASVRSGMPLSATLDFLFIRVSVIYLHFNSPLPWWVLFVWVKWHMCAKIAGFTNVYDEIGQLDVISVINSWRMHLKMATLKGLLEDTNWRK